MSKVNLTEIFKQLSQIPFEYQNLDDGLQRITELGKQLIDSHTFVLTLIDTETQIVLKVICSSNNQELESLINNQKIFKNEVEFFKQKGFVSQVLNKYRLKEYYRYPLWSAESAIVGYIYHFSSLTKSLNNRQRGLFKSFASRAIVTIERAKTNQKAREYFKDSQKLKKLTEIMLTMINCNNIDDIFKSLLDGALKLVTVGHKKFTHSDKLIGEISLLYITGELSIVEQNKLRKNNFPLKLDEGITGKALKDGKTIRIDDVSNCPDYQKCWQDTRSEIAIPIRIEAIPVRQGKKVTLGSKPIGVLNIESPETAFFSEKDEQYLSLLSSYAAVLIDRQESNEKLKKLRKKEREITRGKNHDEIMEELMESITDILGFQVVNISLVNFETQTIKTEFMKDINAVSETQINEFKKEADHSLESNDIQAHIVRNKEIEVPSSDDPRFDRKLYTKYKHGELIRVFIPMIETFRDRVIGTLEAGYKRQYRNYIYERDVQILESFVNHVVQTLEQEKSGMIDRVTHEFKSPIVGIRSNASFMQRRLKELSNDLIDKKLGDILTLSVRVIKSKYGIVRVITSANYCSLLVDFSSPLQLNLVIQL